MRAQRTARKAADGRKNAHLHVHGTAFEKACRGKGGAAGGAELVGGIGVVGRQPGKQIGRQTDQPAAAGCRIHKACKAGHQHEKRHHPRRDRDTHCYNSSYLSKSFVLFQGTRALDHIKPPLEGTEINLCNLTRSKSLHPLGGRWRVAPDEGYSNPAPSSVTCGDSFPRPGEAFIRKNDFHASQGNTQPGIPAQRGGIPGIFCNFKTFYYRLFLKKRYALRQ